MYQVETDSEDDYECLFLKPVDGYNISDRIRQANEELFAAPDPESPSVIPRKVTFRKVLEDFDDGADNLSIVSVDSTSETNSQDQHHNSKKNLKHIPEEEEEEEEEEDEDERKRCKNVVETEEICEEIIELKLDEPEIIIQKSSTISSTCTTTTTATATSTDNQNQTSQEDNKLVRPKTPPLPTLQEEKDSSIKLREISLNSPYSSFDKTTVSPSSSEDDLSIIVASYIPEGIEVIEDKSTTDDREKIQNMKKIKKPKFSFRKKKKCNTTSSTTTSTSTSSSSSSPPPHEKFKNGQNKKSNKSEDIKEQDLKFHHKTCCEYRNAIDTNATLPKYTGYLSEYGLSKEQLQKRHTSLEKQKKKILEKNLKASEYEINKMEDNERAFTRWLKNKMKFPVNKTKNMFDFRQTKNAKKAKS